MAVHLKSFIDRITPSTSRRPSIQGPSSGEFVTAPNDKLFPATNPAIDGGDCLHDCESCTIKYPAKFEVDQEDELYGNVGAWDTHLIVATGKTDWVRDVEDEIGSVMEAIGKGSVKPNGTLKLSASNMPIHHTSVPSVDGSSTPTNHDSSTVILLPAFICIDNVTPATVPDLITNFINPASTNTTPLASSSSLPPPTSTTPQPSSTSTPPSQQSTPPPPLLLPLTSRPCPHTYLILLCSQKTRDARCGQSAPLLRREFERQLRPLGLHRDLADERPGGCGIYFISHVGGHKYSANVMIYRRDGAAGTDGGEGQGGRHREASQCIWLARVRPEDCENIVRYTLLQGKVVKPERQLRGGFDRGRGLVSW